MSGSTGRSKQLLDMLVAFVMTYWVVVVAVLAVYVAGTIGLWNLVVYFYGDDGRAASVIRAISTPIAFVYHLGEWVVQMVTSPWRVRRERLLWKELGGLGIDIRGYLSSPLDPDAILKSLAANALRAFEAQEDLRGTAGRTAEDRLRSADAQVAHSKSRFWLVHGIVKKHGYPVRPKIENYYS